MLKSWIELVTLLVFERHDSSDRIFWIIIIWIILFFLAAASKFFSGGQGANGGRIGGEGADIKTSQNCFLPVIFVFKFLSL